MSATLRYDIGLNLGQELSVQFECVWKELEPERTSRWGGAGKARKQVWTFALALPGQLDLAERFLACLGRMRASGPALSSLVALRNKLWLSLGLPEGHRYAPGEEEMMAGLRGQLDAWLVYADWLDDGRAGAYGEARAKVIRAWADPQVACEVKYGVPVLAREADQETSGD
jgi:hypothetical protein